MRAGGAFASGMSVDGLIAQRERYSSPAKLQNRSKTRGSRGGKATAREKGNPRAQVARLVEAGDDEQALLLRELHVLLAQLHPLERGGEPSVPAVRGREDGREEEVEERPELCEVVLDRGACSG